MAKARRSVGQEKKDVQPKQKLERFGQWRKPICKWEMALSDRGVEAFFIVEVGSQ